MSDIIDEFEDIEADAVEARGSDLKSAVSFRNWQAATKKRRFAPGHEPLVDTSHRRPQPSLPTLNGWLDRPIPSIKE